MFLGLNPRLLNLVPHPEHPFCSFPLLFRRFKNLCKTQVVNKSNPILYSKMHKIQ